MTQLSIRTIAVRGLIAAVLAALVNVLLVAIATTLALAPGFLPISYPPVIFLTVLGVAAASAVFAFLVRSRPRPVPLFKRIAAAALLVSFLPDFALLVGDPNATPAGVVVLMLMHVVAAASALLVLTRGPGPSE